MLTAAEIAGMRTVAETTFDGTAIIHRHGYVSDGSGGGTSTWTPSGTVACHLSPITLRGEREPVIGGRVTPDADWILTIPAETSIDRAARVEVAGVNFEVLALHAPRTWELTRRVELAEVT